MTEPGPFWDEERSPFPGPVPVTETDLRGWESRYGVSLPATLAAQLLIQNGGGVLGAEYFIEPLARIAPLTDEQLEYVSEEEEDLDLTDGSRLFTFGYHEVGSTLVLDYTVGPEPRVISLWFDGSGGSRSLRRPLTRLWRVKAARPRMDLRTTPRGWGIAFEMVRLQPILVMIGRRAIDPGSKLRSRRCSGLFFGPVAP